jgi:hypothetical protein
VFTVIALGVGAWFVLTRGGAEQTTIPSAYDGTWSGTVHQGEGFEGRSVQVTITMRAGQRTALMKVNPEPCAGDLTLTEVRSGDLTFELGPGQCRATTVELGTQGDGGTLVFHASGPGTYTASGTLGRAGG